MEIWRTSRTCDEREEKKRWKRERGEIAWEIERARGGGEGARSEERRRKKERKRRENERERRLQTICHAKHQRNTVK